LLGESLGGSLGAVVGDALGTIEGASLGKYDGTSEGESLINVTSWRYRLLPTTRSCFCCCDPEAWTPSTIRRAATRPAHNQGSSKPEDRKQKATIAKTSLFSCSFIFIRPLPSAMCVSLQSLTLFAFGGGYWGAITVVIASWELLPSFFRRYARPLQYCLAKLGVRTHYIVKKYQNNHCVSDIYSKT
jgi:hypothetical protein